MSTQGSVEGCQITGLLWGGSVCIQTGWGIGNVHRMEPGSRNWVPTTLVLVPLWDVTVGELRLFSGITEILAEIERNWKCGRRILSRVILAKHCHTQTLTHTLPFMFKQMQMDIYANILPQVKLRLWANVSLNNYDICHRSFVFISSSSTTINAKQRRGSSSTASTVSDACLHSMKCGGLLCFLNSACKPNFP